MRTPNKQARFGLYHARMCAFNLRTKANIAHKSRQRSDQMQKKARMHKLEHLSLGKSKLQRFMDNVYIRQTHLIVISDNYDQ